MPIVTIELDFQLENLQKTKEYGLPSILRLLFNCKDFGAAALGLHSWIKTSPLAFNLYI